MTIAYPLAWPPGWPRTPAAKREKGQFRTTLAAALGSLQKELNLLGGKSLVLSSNVSLGAERPTDPGVVAYFEREGKQIAIPCDRWLLVEHNVRAIANTIEAMRAIERWGAKHMITAMFQGFAAISAPGAFDWRAILGIKPGIHATADLIQQRRRDLAAMHHPDKAGGDAARMSEINAAADAALKELQQ